MFQSFDTTSDSTQSAARVARLRAAMMQAGVDGVIVPLADAHQGEYVADCDARLAWLTGFTGSAGFAVVLADEAAVFVDGRYTVQVRGQIDLSLFTPVDWPATRSHDWIMARRDQAVIAYDPWLHSVDDIDRLRAALPDAITLLPTPNMVDAIWDDRPDRPAAPMRIHPTQFAGRSHGDKRADLAAELRKAGHAAAIMTLTDATCWLLNIRGADIPRNPIVQAFSILHDDGRVDLFTDAPVDADVADHLGKDVTIHPRMDLLEVAGRITGPILLDKASAPVVLRDTLADTVLGDDPCALPKARKNATEIEGARAAHLRDGAAVVRFLHWFDTVDGPITEIDAATTLERMRHDTGALLELSFDTISAAGPNAAMAHYRVTHDSNRTLRDGELFLIDSGGQYQDGTTDITRTMAYGTPRPDHAGYYTRVLQGVIALHRARFPRGVGGAHLDVLARNALWQAGLDFDHGTGHGVGSYLCVHEGPRRISSASPEALEPGMILSNEPGYYRADDFGIRIENLIVVRDASPLDGQDDRPWLSFENLTWVPFDRRLIDAGLLTDAEREWIDTYHAETLARIGPLVPDDVREWLERACAPL